VQDEGRNEQTERWGYLQDCLPRYFDGSVTVLDIAETHDLPFVELYEYIERFEKKGLIHLEFSAMERKPPLRAAVLKNLWKSQRQNTI
jgi:hypothetical protein